TFFDFIVVSVSSCIASITVFFCFLNNFIESEDKFLGQSSLCFLIEGCGGGLRTRKAHFPRFQVRGGVPRTRKLLFTQVQVRGGVPRTRKQLFTRFQVRGGIPRTRKTHFPQFQVRG